MCPIPNATSRASLRSNLTALGSLPLGTLQTIHQARCHRLSKGCRAGPELLEVGTSIVAPVADDDEHEWLLSASCGKQMRSSRCKSEAGVYISWAYEFSLTFVSV
jgi:hypothetical protein